MMKYLMVIGLLLSLSSNAQDENKKRPSWSQGLPERQAVLKPMDSGFKPADNDDTLNSTPGLATIDEPNLPSIDVNLLENPVLVPEPVLVIETESLVPTASNRKAAFEQYHSNDNSAEVSSNVVNPMIAEYKWIPIKTLPIEVPASSDKNKQLKLVIQINPKGQVVAVDKADANISALVLQSAEKSILKWRFEPPSDLGITENISKTFDIEIEFEA
jgi:hypothetical protein